MASCPGSNNDECVNAIPVTLNAGTTTTITGNTAGFTHSANDACGAGPDVWYTFTLSQPEVVFVDTFGSSYDTEVALFNGCGALVVCNDDAIASDGTFCGNLQSETVAVLAAGTHMIAVSGFGANSGAFTLHIQHMPAAGGTSQVLLRGGALTITGSTAGAANGSSSSCGGNAQSGDNLYYYTTCPAYAGGAFDFSFCTLPGTASYDSVLYFRQANGVVDICNDDACGLQSHISGAVSAGAALRGIYVDGFSTTNNGSYTLLYTVP
jgi:hypothetical protein